MRMSKAPIALKVDAATLRMVSALAQSRATTTALCGDQSSCECGSRALFQLACDLEAIASEAERATENKRPCADQRLAIERAVRRHLEVATAAALGPDYLHILMGKRPSGSVHEPD